MTNYDTRKPRSRACKTESDTAGEIGATFAAKITFYQFIFAANKNVDDCSMLHASRSRRTITTRYLRLSEYFHSRL